MNATHHEQRAAILRKLDDAPNATAANDLRCQLEEHDARQADRASMGAFRRALQWILCRLFNHRRIMNCERKAYLWRWYLIRSKAFAVFLHNFVRSDEDRALHDHPWRFIVIPIWRGYWEHSEDAITCDQCGGTGVFTIKEHGGGFWVNCADHCFTCGGTGTLTRQLRRRVFPLIGARMRPATFAHRVELFEDRDGNPLHAWSIFIRFREVRDWGFLLPSGWQDWRQWWAEKCE